VDDNGSMSEAARLRIRGARPDDAPAIAEIHVRGWRWAYPGLVPDELLDSLSVERRERHWRDGLSEPGTRLRIWLAEREGRVVGFVATGPSQDADAAPGTAEVYAIYLEPDAVGTGVGRRLFAHAVDDLRARGYPAATLWVLESNSRTRRFYEIGGWRPDGTMKTEPWAGFDIQEVRYRIELA